MSKALRMAAFPRDVARPRPIELPLEVRPAWGVYMVERAPDGLRLTVEAATLAGLFVDAARAMGEQLGEPALAPQATRAPEAHQLSVVAATVDQLMTAWLGELLHCARQGQRWFGDISVGRISPGHLRAELCADQDMRWRFDLAAIAIVDTRVATTVTESGARRLVARFRLATGAGGRGG
jgi:hypothetical protein